MRIDLTISVQFMMKDRERDIPQMSGYQTYTLGYEVEVPPEFATYIDKYLEGIENGVTPKYDAPKAIVKLWRPKVRRVYPELWSQTNQYGDRHRFTVTDDTVIDAAICISIDDVIDKYLASSSDEILKNLGIEKPVDTPTHYLSGVFIRKISWKNSK